MITDTYRLEVGFPSVVDQQHEWRLEVIGPDGKKLPNVRLVYPHMVSPLVSPEVQVVTPPKPVRIGPGVTQPRLVKQALPSGNLGERLGLPAIVILEVEVGTDGRVRAARVLSGIRFFSAPAIAAVRQWRWEPMLLDGAPSPFMLTVTINYNAPFPRIDSLVRSLKNNDPEIRAYVAVLVGEKWYQLSQDDKKKMEKALRDLLESEKNESVRTAAQRALAQFPNK